MKTYPPHRLYPSKFTKTPLPVSTSTSTHHHRRRGRGREMGFSLVSLVDFFVRRAYTAAGLRPLTIPIDDDTTVHCWISSSLLPPPSSGDVEIESAKPANKSEKKKAPPAKPPVLLIHGFGPRATWQWRSQISALAPHFDLIVPDLLFFGGSTTRSPQRSEAFQAAALAGLLDALGVAPPRRERVAVVGTSYGGFVAYHLARAMGPGRVARVVIASSDLLKGPEDDRALAERAGGTGSVTEILIPRTTTDMKRLAELAVHRPVRHIPHCILRDMLQNLFGDKVEEKLELIDGVTLFHKDESQLTPLPDQQVLIMWGEHDRIFPLDKAIKIQKRLGENARLEVIKNTGHMPQMEDTKKFNNILLNFLLAAQNFSSS